MDAPNPLPGHPDYPLFLARAQLRSAVLQVVAGLEALGEIDAPGVAARALWDLAMEHDAERAAKVVPLMPPSERGCRT